MSETLSLQTRPLGTTDMEITRVGFGAWAIGGGDWSFGWGPQDDEASVAAIRHAVASGINWIDTAAVYGVGHSETVVARALEDIPAADRPYVFTKCGLIVDPKKRQDPARRVGKAESIKREAEASLKRLKVERIDLLQMHWPAEDTGIDEYWQALLDLKTEGKVRAIGLSNHDAAQLAEAEAIGHVDTLQPPFSAIKRGFAGETRAWCEAHRTGVIVYSPMQSGLLSGGFSEERAKKLDKADWRARSENFTGEGLKKNLALAHALEPVAFRHKTSVAAVAVAWTLGWDGVTAAIVGARSPEQVDGWISAASLSLTPRDMREIAIAIEASGAGEGPALPARLIAGEE